MDLAQLATRAFEQGYDMRFGLTMAIPVVLCDLSIRLIWGLRHYFGYHKPLNECIPNDQHDDLRVMLLVGNGALCLVDGIDAVARSGGNPLAIFMRLNLVAWFRFVMLAVKELCIRLGLSLGIQKNIEAFKRINAALQVYLAELEKIDIEAFHRETEEYNKMMSLLDNAKDENDLNDKLYTLLDRMGIKMSWQSTHDSFDSFMRDKSAVLRFE